MKPTDKHDQEAFQQGIDAGSLLCQLSFLCLKTPEPKKTCAKMKQVLDSLVEDLE
jgi:hypothetical protein